MSSSLKYADILRKVLSLSPSAAIRLSPLPPRLVGKGGARSDQDNMCATLCSQTVCLLVLGACLLSNSEIPGKSY